MLGELNQGLNQLLMSDPLLGYSAIAAGFLVVVSLLSGLLRLDVMALVRGRTLLFLGLAASSALFVYLLGTDPSPISLADRPQARFIEGSSRLPLYLLALAYGPGVGVLGGLLFTSLLLGLTSVGLGAFPLLLLTELAVLGWLALEPSVFERRWAGPFNITAALLLSWATAGTAILQMLQYNAASFSAHWHYHKYALLGLCPALLLWIPPQVYARVCAGSRVPLSKKRVSLSKKPAESARAQDTQPVKDRRLETIDLSPIRERSLTRRRRELEPVWVDELDRLSA